MAGIPGPIPIPRVTFFQQLFSFDNAAAAADPQAGTFLEFFEGGHTLAGQVLNLAIVYAVAQADIHAVLNTMRLILSVNPYLASLAPKSDFFSAYGANFPNSRRFSDGGNLLRRAESRVQPV